jgi:hypothetical protein
MSFKILSVCLFGVGMATATMAASSGSSGGGDRGGLGDSPNAGDSSNYRSSITQRGDADNAEERDPDACWKLPRSADGKSIVAPSEAKPVVPRKCN